MVKGKGWHEHPVEHALAAKGIKSKTQRNNKIKTKTHASTIQTTNQTKNPLDEANGGIPAGGGYKGSTEMDVPATRIGEASHCILGSMNRQRGWPQWPKGELPHTDEEMGIIRESIDDGKYRYHLDRDWHSHSKKYKDESLMYIYKNSPELRMKASKALSDLELYKNQLDPHIYEISKNTYKVLISLSYAMEKSVEKGKMVRNPYHDIKLNQDIDRLQMSVERWKMS